MSAIAAIIEWGAPGTSSRTSAELESALGVRKANPIRAATCPGATLGISLLAPDASRRRDVQPLIDTAARVAVVADCRLDNRESLRSELSLAAEATDSRLLLAGYQRWGEDVGQHLRGDFAGVFWDWGKQLCVAVRDPLAVKPLFHARPAGRLVVGSDVEIVLQLIRPAPIPDDRAVVEHLLWEYASPERTFWAAVSRLPGGHVLVEGEAQVRRIQRYWTPNPRARRFSATGEVHEELRRLFFQSVERRLDSDGPVLAHLSGGLDSSLTVCVADQIRRQRKERLLRIGTVSQRFPDSPWDEGDFIQAVTDWTGLENTQWDGGTAEFRDLARPVLAGPGMATARSSGSAGDLEIARQKDVHVLLSGDGGDQLGMPSGVTDDTARRHPIDFLMETLRRPNLSVRSKLARAQRIARLFVPVSVKQTLGISRYRRQLPDWLQPRWRGVVGDIVASLYPTRFERGFEHSVQRAHWRDLTSARIGMALDLQQRSGAEHGVEFRFPFFDQDLVEFVLSIPPQHWPSEAPGARLHRESMGDLVPPSIRERRTKAIFSGAIGRFLSRAAPLINALFHEGDWISARYVRRTEAQSLLRRALADENWQARWREWQQVRAIATLEAWLREVFGYARDRGEPTYDRATG